MLKRLLYVTPFALLPATEGHRKRMMMTFEQMRAAGYDIDILFISREYPWSDRFDRRIFPEMQRLAGNFFFLRQPTPRPPEANVYTIDEWWSEECDELCQWIFANNGYEAIFCNYVFMSRVFENVKYKTRKLLETHDVFTDRKKMLLENGLVPEFFYTSRMEERKGIRRADLVISIKDEEAGFYRTLTTSEVVTLPYIETGIVPVPRVPPADPDAPRKTIYGFFASSNSLNVQAVHEFADYLVTQGIDATADFEIHLYGSVCNRLGGALPGCMKAMGLLDRAEEFYGLVDGVINFQRFSTGLKIKIAEALSHRLPLISLTHAFEGFGRAAHPAQRCETLDDLLREMRRAATDAAYLDEIGEAAATVERALTQRTQAAAARLFGVAETSPTMLFIVSGAQYNRSAAYRHIVASFRSTFAMIWNQSVFVAADRPAGGEFQVFVDGFGCVLDEGDLAAIAGASIAIVLSPSELDEEALARFRRVIVVADACDLVLPGVAAAMDTADNALVVRCRGLLPAREAQADEDGSLLHVSLFRWVPWELSLSQNLSRFRLVDEVWVFHCGAGDAALDAMLATVAAPSPLRGFAAEAVDGGGWLGPQAARKMLFDSRMVPRAVIAVGDCPPFALVLEWLIASGIEIRRIDTDLAGRIGAHSGFNSSLSRQLAPLGGDADAIARPVSDWQASGWSALANVIGRPPE